MFAGLMRAALDSAWIRDARSLFLEVAVHNAPALALYLGMGFQEVGRRPRYYKNGADALVLRCVLRAPAAESVN